MNKYQQSFERLERYFQGRLERGNNKYPFTRHDLLLIEKAIYERSHLIKALKDINEILERLTLEQKKPLGATVYSIQAIIIETLERSEE